MKVEGVEGVEEIEATQAIEDASLRPEDVLIRPKSPVPMGAISETQFIKLLEVCHKDSELPAREKAANEAASKYKLTCSQMIQLIKVLRNADERELIAHIIAPR